MARVVVTISISNVRVAPAPPTALVNTQGASFSLLFCVHFAPAAHVWCWQFRFLMSGLPLGLPPPWWISKVHHCDNYFAVTLPRRAMCGGDALYILSTIVGIRVAYQNARGKFSPVRLGRVSHYIATLQVSMQICQVRILMPSGFPRPPPRSGE